MYMYWLIFISCITYIEKFPFSRGWKRLRNGCEYKGSLTDTCVHVANSLPCGHACRIKIHISVQSKTQCIYHYITLLYITGNHCNTTDMYTCMYMYTYLLWSYICKDAMTYLIIFDSGIKSVCFKLWSSIVFHLNKHKINKTHVKIALRVYTWIRIEVLLYLISESREWRNLVHDCITF